MKYETATLLIAFFGLSTAAPMPKLDSAIIPRFILRGREVPQEHSHNRFLDGVRVNLDINNPAGIADPVFGLLGDAAAASGAGTITNLACLHQATADQAFTNAKAAGNVTGQADALLYAALERNTGKVGLASAACTDTAVNPEIQAVQQHQDPASSGAAATNKAIVLELAKQLASIGADPQLALLSGTFAPGDVNDPTAAGNTCDTADDVQGCIFTQNLLVDDATPEEIDAAVAGTGAAASGSAVASSSAAAASSTSAAVGDCAASVVTSTVEVSAATTSADTASAATASASVTATPDATGTVNVQTFTGSLGGPPPPVESSSGDRPFSVNGDTFVNIGAALQRSCSVQHNACANAANSGSISASVADCETQEAACNAAASSGAAPPASVASSASATTSASAASSATAATSATSATAATSTSATSSANTGTLDFGTCTDPSIIFADGLDGRNQPAFQASNQADFNHGSALNIGVIAQFICGQLATSCKAPAATNDACTAAESAAGAATGQAAADAFNSALGVSA